MSILFPTEEERIARTLRKIDAVLAEMQNVLKQMLALATLSASDGLEVDRAALQRTLDRLQAKLDKLSDKLP